MTATQAVLLGGVPDPQKSDLPGPALTCKGGAGFFCATLNGSLASGFVGEAIWCYNAASRLW